MRVKQFRAFFIGALLFSQVAVAFSISPPDQKFFSCKTPYDCTAVPEFGDCNCPCDTVISRRLESEYESSRRVNCKSSQPAICNKICAVPVSVACISGKCSLAPKNDPDVAERVRKLCNQSDLVVIGKLKIGQCLDGCQGSIEEAESIKGRLPKFVTLRPGSVFPIPFMDRSKIWFLKNLGNSIYEPLPVDAITHQLSIDSRTLEISVCKNK